jgi:hypothetical protein
LPGFGEIYQILVQNNRDLVIASYEGLYLGQILSGSIDGAYFWKAKEVFLKNKVISAVC